MPKDTRERIIDARAGSFSGGAVAASGGGGGGTGVTDHGALTGLADDDHTQYLLASGGRTLAGSLAVTAGATIDGVDISAHAADPEAHHDLVTAGTLVAVTGQQVSVANASAAYQMLQAGASSPFAPAYVSMATLAGDGLSASDGAFHVGTPGTLTTSSANSVNNLSHFHQLDHSSSPGAAAKILSSSAAGNLALVSLTTPLVNTASGPLTIAPATDVYMLPAGGEVFFGDTTILRSETWTPGLLGTGWGVSWKAAGLSHVDARSAYFDELSVKLFLADFVRVRMGETWLGQSLAISTTLASNTTGYVTAPAAVDGTTFIYVEDLPEMPDTPLFDSAATYATGDWLMVKTLEGGPGGSMTLSMLWGQVAGYTDLSGADEGKQRWGFILRSGAPNTKIYKGSTFVSFGKAGDGYIHESVVDGTAQAFTRYATWSGANPYTPANRAVHVQIGDLINTPGTGANHQWGIAAGNNIGNAEANFTGIVAGSGGVRIYNSAVSQYNGALRTGAWSQTGNLFLGTDVDDADKRALSFFASSGTLQIGNPNYPGTVTVYGTISVQAAGTINYGNLSGKPANLADINSAEGTKLGGIAAGATVGATWGTNLASVPARFGDTAGAAGLYLTPTHMGYWTGSAWTAYIRNNGEFYFKDGTSTNYLEWTAGGVLHGVGGGVEQWSASSSTGKLTAGAGTVTLDAAGITITGVSNTSTYNFWFKVGASARSSIQHVAGVAGDQTDWLHFQHYGVNQPGRAFAFTGAKVLAQNGLEVTGSITTTSLTASGNVTAATLTTTDILRAASGGTAVHHLSKLVVNNYNDALRLFHYDQRTNGYLYFLHVDGGSNGGDVYINAPNSNNTIYMKVGDSDRFYVSPVRIDVASGILVGGNWQTVTYGTPFGAYAGSGDMATNANVRVKKFGDLVYLRGVFRVTATGQTGEIAFTLPAGYAPARWVAVPIVRSTGQTLVAIIYPEDYTGTRDRQVRFITQPSETVNSEWYSINAVYSTAAE